MFLLQFNNCTERCITARESGVSDYSRCKQQRWHFVARFLGNWDAL